MQNNFKVGDKVAVTDSMHCFTGVFGEITSINELTVILATPTRVSGVDVASLNDLFKLTDAQYTRLRKDEELLIKLNNKMKEVWHRQQEIFYE